MMLRTSYTASYIASLYFFPGNLGFLIQHTVSNEYWLHDYSFDDGSQQYFSACPEIDADE